MWNNFFKHVDIRAENTHILDGNACDLQQECEAFEGLITAAGGIELFVGGEEDGPSQPNTSPAPLFCSGSYNSIVMSVVQGSFVSTNTHAR